MLRQADEGGQVDVRIELRARATSTSLRRGLDAPARGGDVGAAAEQVGRQRRPAAAPRCSCASVRRQRVQRVRRLRRSARPARGARARSARRAPRSAARVSGSAPSPWRSSTLVSRPACDALADQRQHLLALRQRALATSRWLDQPRQLHVGARDVASASSTRAACGVGLRRRARRRARPRARRGCGRRSRAPTSRPSCAVPLLQMPPPSGGGIQAVLAEALARQRRRRRRPAGRRAARRRRRRRPARARAAPARPSGSGCRRARVRPGRSSCRVAEAVPPVGRDRGSPAPLSATPTWAGAMRRGRRRDAARCWRSRRASARPTRRARRAAPSGPAERAAQRRSGAARRFVMAGRSSRSPGRGAVGVRAAVLSSVRSAASLDGVERAGCAQPASRSASPLSSMRRSRSFSACHSLFEKPARCTFSTSASTAGTSSAAASPSGVSSRLTTRRSSLERTRVHRPLASSRSSARVIAPGSHLQRARELGDGRRARRAQLEQRHPLRVGQVVARRAAVDRPG